MYQVWSTYSNGRPNSLMYEGTLDECRKEARRLREKFPRNNYVVVKEGGVVADREGYLIFRSGYIV